MNKLPDILNEKQKLYKINKILSLWMCKNLKLIRNTGSKKSPRWELAQKGENG
ncbi:MAG: hypothetical protein H7844_13135 [Nitrospirae bacterium YQR-1]